MKWKRPKVALNPIKFAKTQNGRRVCVCVCKNNSGYYLQISLRISPRFGNDHALDQSSRVYILLHIQIRVVQRKLRFFFNWYNGGGGVQMGPLGTAASLGWLWWWRNWWNDWQGKPFPVSLCPQRTPHPPSTPTRAAAVGGQRLTAWATARPHATESNVTHGRSRLSILKGY
jgi:hypothetical protein